MNEPSERQIKHNQSLWKYFPLGQIDAIWHLVEHLHQETGFNEEVDKVLEALQKLDDKIRAARFPLPKQKVKRSKCHDITTTVNKGKKSK